jgi:hypothetical protein
MQPIRRTAKLILSDRDFVRAVDRGSPRNERKVANSAIHRTHPRRVRRCVTSGSHLWITLVLTATGACSWGSDTTIRPVDASQIEHAQQSDQLTSLMGDLGRLRDEQLTEAMAPGVERSRKVEAIAQTAGGIARSAERIAFARPQDSPQSLNPSEFQMRAEILRRLSTKLAQRAATSPDAKLQELVDAIDATCAGCHTRFRP